MKTFPKVFGVGLACGFLAVADAPAANEPSVVEQTRPNGLTELAIVSGGTTNATYRVDLNTHHEPATKDTGVIRQWENCRFGGFFCFNDNQYVFSEYSKNKEPKLFNPSNLDIAGWAVAMQKAGMKYAVLTTRHHPRAIARTRDPVRRDSVLLD